MKTVSAAIAVLAVWVAAMPAQAPQRSSVIELSGRVTVADKGLYQEHAFDVPAGVTRLDVEFTYQNPKADTELEVGLFDARRFRGTSRFSKQRFHLTEFEATPSYVPGPIVPGTWRVSLGVPSIGANTAVEWRCVIRMSSAPTPREGLAPALRAAAGWYVGDLHAHTLHSDAFGCEDADAPGRKRGCQPWEVVEAARARQLDFLAVTDHNTTSHHADLATIQESLLSLLLLRGQELTTFHGHANIYGTSRPIDFRLGFRGRSMLDVMNDVAEQGALLSINHPGRESGDRCTGCGWDAPLTPWDRIEAMEVVNGAVVEGPTAGMPVWYAKLNQGYRITGVGGSDDHAVRPGGRVGSPATVVFARELSEAALLDGLRAGHVYVRTRGPEGPVIDLTTSANGQTVGMGGSLHPAAGGPLHLDLRVERAAGQKAEIVRNADVMTTIDVPSDASSLSYTLPVAAGQWVHVRLRDRTGITAFSNPIYVK